MKRWSKSKSPVTKKLKLRTTLMADWWHARIPCGIANLAMHGYFCLVIIVIRVQVSNHPGIRTMRMRTVTINGRMFPLYKYQEWITPGQSNRELRRLSRVPISVFGKLRVYLDRLHSSLQEQRITGIQKLYTAYFCLLPTPSWNIHWSLFSQSFDT